MGMLEVKYNKSFEQRELPGGGSMAMAVGVSCIWQVTGVTSHVIPDMWNCKVKEKENKN